MMGIRNDVGPGGGTGGYSDLDGEHNGGFDGSLGRSPDGDSLDGIGGRRGGFDEDLDGDLNCGIGMDPD